MTTTGKFFGDPGCPVTEGLNKKFAVTDEDIRAASAETERLARELDITNADHIALWLEANMADSSPAWLACRIVEAHEAALPKPTPVEAALREAINIALVCTPQVRDGQIIYDCGDPWEILRAALSETLPEPVGVDLLNCPLNECQTPSACASYSECLANRT